MCFGYLNHVNWLLSKIMSDENYDTYSYDIKRSEPCLFGPYYENDPVKKSVNNRSDTCIVISHVSRTALIPFDIMIDNLAFEINGKAYAFGFMGMGTNRVIKYDGIQADSYWSFHHDYKNHVICIKYNISSMMCFKKLLAEHYKNPSIQYILYRDFHEAGGQQVHEFCKRVSELAPDTLSGNIASDSGFVLDDAEYLKKKCDDIGFGATLEERAAGYKTFVLEGINLIREALRNADVVSLSVLLPHS